MTYTWRFQPWTEWDTDRFIDIIGKRGLSFSGVTQRMNRPTKVIFYAVSGSTSQTSWHHDVGGDLKQEGINSEFIVEEENSEVKLWPGNLKWKEEEQRNKGKETWTKWKS